MRAMPMSLADMREHCVRFDRSDAPKPGSRWLNRGSGRIVLVIGAEMQGDIPLVLTRGMSDAGLDTGTQRMVLHDLWRNHELLMAEAPVISMAEGEEYEKPDGKAITVLRVDRALGILFVQDGRVERTVFESFLAGMPKVERRNAWDMLGDE